MFSDENPREGRVSGREAKSSQIRVVVRNGYEVSQLLLSASCSAGLLVSERNGLRFMSARSLFG